MAEIPTQTSPTAAAGSRREAAARARARATQAASEAAAKAAPAAAGTTDIIQVLTTCVQRGGSDVVLTAGTKPRVRLGGRLRTLGEEVLTAEQTKRILYGLLTDEQKAVYEETWEIDFAVAIRNVGRFRVNGFRQRGAAGAAFRPIPSKVPSVDDLDLPKVIHDFATYPRGLVLVTGVTGSGKSTLLAALINKINTDRECHIVTIEDPIEFVHPHKKSVVEQREVGSDTKSFGAALKHILRQNPDVILLGEMRDPETISAAITLAETGHLVFSTLHTQTCAQTMDRMIDSFPGSEQSQVRAQLSLTLKAVISQSLLPAKDGVSRVAAREVMIVTTAIANLIREGKTHMITNAIGTNRAIGMVTMETSVKALIEDGRVDPTMGAVYLRGIEGPLIGQAESKAEDKDDPNRVVKKVRDRDGGEPEFEAPSSIDDPVDDDVDAYAEPEVVNVSMTMPTMIIEKFGILAAVAGFGYLTYFAGNIPNKIEYFHYCYGLFGVCAIEGGLRYSFAAARRKRAFGR